MATPNLLQLTSVIPSTAMAAITTTATALVTNTSSSNKVLKISALYISNIDGTNDGEATIDVFRSSVAYHIAKTVTIPADATLDVINTAVYLQEGDSLRITASVDNTLQAVCSYEDIS